ncbi:hypothetical protein AURDEDRAFT_172858 [Auricularia subglabra TFB-10046 SS5]|uniref:Uncharacterized protein n=1 Tax=Auricularia subglabra (strain TFB-10046 / SS5) TaxID=717982 RepID=J0LIF1_AURST|nr:hypothetical protein AURDEDRAFT_172858 [Auricularia subglabra TFB-10046 SS5]
MALEVALCVLDLLLARNRALEAKAKVIHARLDALPNMSTPARRLSEPRAPGPTISPARSIRELFPPPSPRPTFFSIHFLQRQRSIPSLPSPSDRGCHLRRYTHGRTFNVLELPGFAHRPRRLRSRRSMLASTRWKTAWQNCIESATGLQCHPHLCVHSSSSRAGPAHLAHVTPLEAEFLFSRRRELEVETKDTTRGLARSLNPDPGPLLPHIELRPPPQDLLCPALRSHLPYAAVQDAQHAGARVPHRGTLDPQEWHMAQLAAGQRDG